MVGFNLTAAEGFTITALIISECTNSQNYYCYRSKVFFRRISGIYRISAVLPGQHISQHSTNKAVFTLKHNSEYFIEFLNREVITFNNAHLKSEDKYGTTS
jgi:hypothetical protein